MNYKFFTKIVCILLCFVLFLSIGEFTTKTSAASLSELKQQQQEAQKHLNDLKNQKAEQDKIKAGLDKQIAATQAIIDAYNEKISEYSVKINAKQAEIDKMNEAIADTKMQLKKRMRAIYMSNTQNNIQILLGADNFSDFLVLSEMAKRVSAHDKALIDEIIGSIELIEKEKAEIQKLLDEQNLAKKEIDAQKAILDAQVAEVQKVINGLQHDINQDLADLEAISKEIDKQTAPSVGNGGIASSDGLFLWPSASFFYISAGFDSGDSVHKGYHKGIDIAGSGISGTPVRAAASGTVYNCSGYCTHNYGKNYSCGCGGGYGNFVAIDHGAYDGNYYKTLYGHMSKIIVSKGQHVERGQIIGYVGTTGWSTGPHIHFETILNGVKVNPQRFSYARS